MAVCANFKQDMQDNNGGSGQRLSGAPNAKRRRIGDLTHSVALAVVGVGGGTRNATGGLLTTLIPHHRTNLHYS
jgi:hypothetical protein